MEFNHGITPLTFKSIREHNDLLNCNIPEVIEDARNAMSECRVDIRPTDQELEKYFLVFLTVSNDWAIERREVSKIGR